MPQQQKGTLLSHVEVDFACGGVDFISDRRESLNVTTDLHRPWFYRVESNTSCRVRYTLICRCLYHSSVISLQLRGCAVFTFPEKLCRTEKLALPQQARGRQLPPQPERRVGAFSWHEYMKQELRSDISTLPLPAGVPREFVYLRRMYVFYTTVEVFAFLMQGAAACCDSALILSSGVLYSLVKLQCRIIDGFEILFALKSRPPRLVS